VIALFFDTETTGFKSHDFTPEIVQIGALLQDCTTMRVLGELNVIITAKNPIPQVVSDIHGITDELSASAGVESSVAEHLFSQLVIKADLLVAHNIQFDLGIIEGAWPLANAEMSIKEKYCTMLNTMDILQIPGRGDSYKWPKLAEAYRHFFKSDFDNAHDAMADVRACRDVYFKLKEGSL